MMSLKHCLPLPGPITLGRLSEFMSKLDYRHPEGKNCAALLESHLVSKRSQVEG